METSLKGTALSSTNQSSSSVNCRNLRKADLGAVIFGCKNMTMRECLTKQLFGLPGSHFSYVKNIDLGLPLFLFNYSDRTLHGVFEAASAGQLNVDPYAWTTGGSGKTSYPAQVQVHVRLHCQPLPENQFSSIIADNYYARNHFWFELDHAQASKLLSLFSHRVMAPSSLDVNGTFKCRPLFLPHSSHQAVEVTEVRGNCVSSGHSIGNAGPQDSSTTQHNYRQLTETGLKGQDKDAFDTLHQQLQELALTSDSPSATDEPAASNEITTEDSNIEKEVIVQEKQVEDDMISLLVKEIQNLKAEMSCMERKQVKEIQNLKAKMSCMERKQMQSEAEMLRLKEYFPELKSLSRNFDTSSCVMENESFSEPHVDLDNSILFFGGYNGSSWLSSLDSYSLSRDIVRSLPPMSSSRAHASVAKLNGEFYIVGGGIDSVWCDTVESFNPVDSKWNLQPSLKELKGSLATATAADKLFAMGGGDGHQCFSNVEMLDLDVGRWIRTRSMLQKRFAHAAVEMNEVIYAVGGFDGKAYLSSVERFDPREHSWSKISSMNTKRGCHSLVVLNEKLFAIGGYDGTGMVPSVEVYDPRRDSWVLEEDQMKNARGYSSAVVIEDSIYIFGGTNADGVIVDPVERYQQGRGWQITNHRALGQRCFCPAIIYKG